MLTNLQKKTAQAIVNVFETGHVRGDYGRVSFVPGDSGHLTYGRSQVTLASGNLYLLVRSYSEAQSAQFAGSFVPYLERLAAGDLALDFDLAFWALLRTAGGDLAMQEVQDQFFDRVFWEPSVEWADRLKFRQALSVGVVYDSLIHGSWACVKELTDATRGTAGKLKEKKWVNAYVEVRRDWLAGHPNALLHVTVYRMEAFRSLIQANAWQLPLPLTVRGVQITQHELEQVVTCVSADDRRILRLRTPYLVGADVRDLQEALGREGYAVNVDGVFGPLTEAIVRVFQEARGLKVDGVVGPVTRSALGL